MKYEVATPLLFANAMQWLAPDFFRNWETHAEHVGAISSRVGDRVDELQVVDEAGQKLPFTVKEGNVYFFSGHPGAVRVSSSDSEAVHSLTLPEVAAANWSAPADAARGIPGISGTGLGSRDWWQYFALAGALCLFAEWMLFGRRRLLQPETAPARMERIKVRRRFHFAGRKAS
jgi:hypothetical protein